MLTDTLDSVASGLSPKFWLTLCAAFLLLVSFVVAYLLSFIGRVGGDVGIDCRPDEPLQGERRVSVGGVKSMALAVCVAMELCHYRTPCKKIAGRSTSSRFDLPLNNHQAKSTSFALQCKSSQQSTRRHEFGRKMLNSYASGWNYATVCRRHSRSRVTRPVAARAINALYYSRYGYALRLCALRQAEHNFFKHWYVFLLFTGACCTKKVAFLMVLQTGGCPWGGLTYP